MLPARRFTQRALRLEWHVRTRSASRNVYTWGANESGQLGNPTFATNANMPALVPDLLNEEIVQVACGARFTGFVSAAGDLFMSGDGSGGQLGIGTVRSTRPHRVHELHGRVKKVSCGGDHSMVVTKDGELFAFGKGEKGQLGVEVTSVPESLIAQETSIMSSVTSFFRAMVGKKRLHSSHAAQSARAPPLAVLGPVHVSLLTDERVVDVSCGDSHTLALTEGGTVMSWGNNDVGQLGHGGLTTLPHLPRVVSALEGQGIVRVFAGRLNSAALSGNGTLFVWGNNQCNQLLRTPSEAERGLPIAATFNDPDTGLVVNEFQDIAFGGMHTLAINGQGRLYTWGFERRGNLMASSHERHVSSAPKQVLLPEAATAVAAGMNISVVISGGDTVCVSGEGLAGELGLGQSLEGGFLTSPTPVHVLPTIPWRSLAAGPFHVAVA
eukprot:Rmarinus@m.5477